MSVYTIEAVPEATLLDIMESRSIPVESHCRGGFCGCCRTKVLKGEVVYTVEPLAFIDDDEVLPCCCKPLTTLELTTN